jgi:hypothetical protein
MDSVSVTRSYEHRKWRVRWVPARTRSNGCGEDGLAIGTPWSTEGLSMEGLARLEVEGSWDGYRRARTSSETSIDTRNSNYVTDKHIGLGLLVSTGSGVKIRGH